VTEVEAKDVLRRFLRAMTLMDLDAVGALVHPDYVLEHPQSGEVIRGRERFLAMLRAVPGGIPTDSTDEARARVYVEDDRWAVSPMLTPIRVFGSEGTYTTTVPIRYPDQLWHLIAISEVREGLIVRTTQYWAPEFPPADWRAPFVEQTADRSPAPPDRPKAAGVSGAPRTRAPGSRR